MNEKRLSLSPTYLRTGCITKYICNYNGTISYYY